MCKLKPCPRCGADDENLSIDSCSALGLSEVTCDDCGYVFQNHAYEENIYKYWNRIDRSSMLKLDTSHET